MPIQTRMFLGFLQNKEIKINVSLSKKWVEAKVSGTAVLEETLWENKEYIGIYLPPKITYIELKEFEKQIKNQLEIYCPKINLNKNSIYLFSQLFIS